jgi:hypothetical protein
MSHTESLRGVATLVTTIYSTKAYEES